VWISGIVDALWVLCLSFTGRDMKETALLLNYQFFTPEIVPTGEDLEYKNENIEDIIT
jgi:hypothetical protein